MSKFLCACVWVSLFAVSVPAVATTVEPIAFDELVRRADRIFVGTVVAVEPFVDGDAIRTRVTFRVSDVVKGRSSAQVQLTFRGGEVGDRRDEVEGVPQFAVGDEQVMFSRDREGQISPLVGVWHGRVPVVTDATSRKRVLRHDRTPFSETRSVTASATTVSPAILVPMTLEAFLSDVRAAVQAQGQLR